ncbi:NUDIX domain-containing protein [Deinococcus altitudinis]|uniref:NUDIX domain-containing protein n=1 Tax=Deinococcus altitudinis TaxID=468914 RepID=UPI003891204D
MSDSPRSDLRSPARPEEVQPKQAQPRQAQPDLQTRHPNWPTLVPDDTQPWQTLGSAPLSGPPHVLNRDRVRTQAGTELDYLYRPRGPRAVFILPVTAAGEVVLIRQYRYPLRAWITEVVAGGMEAGEDVLQSAARELREEVGGQAAEWIALPAFYPQPSVSGAAFYPLLALGVTMGEARPEPDELLERLVLPLAEAYWRLLAGEILHGPGGLTLFYARPHLEARGFL